MLRPIRDSILFVFLDDVANGRFVDKRDSGIIVHRSLDAALNECRYAKVLTVGDECKHVKKGQTIIIEALRWTEGFTHDGVKIWKTTEKDVVGIVQH